MTEPLIQTVDLHKQYQTGGTVVHALTGIKLAIREGEFVAVMGPSGSGKSTLLNLLGLLDKPTTHSYFFAGRDVGSLDADDAAAIRNRNIGFVFQNFNLLPRSTAVENIELPLVYAGYDRSYRRRLAIAALGLVGLGHRVDHWPRQLSGGEQQRVAIARAIVVDPLLILADEPTGAIDSQTGSEIMSLFQSLNEAGRSIVLVTHDPDVARRAKRIVTMNDGRIVSDEPVRRHLDATSELANHDGYKTITASRPVDHRDSVNLAESVSVALRSLKVNVTRSALTMLGIVIGVASVITMVTVGSGANVQIAEQIRSLGANLLLIQPGSVNSGAVRLGAGTSLALTEQDAGAVASEVSGVHVAAPMVAGNVRLVHGNRNWSSLLGGITPDYLIARDWQVNHGRAFTFEEVESAAKVVLLGTETAEKLFGDDNPLDQFIRIANVPFTVVGVLKEKGQDSDTGRSQDDVALIPLSTAKLRILGRYAQIDRRTVDYVLVKVGDGVGLGGVHSQINSLLRQRHRISPDGQDDFRVSDPAAAMQTRAAATRSLTLLLAAVSSVSLLVGGISIMNIMLVSVTERTREIGVRLAIGARRRDLWSQFLIEALTLCLLGGTAGIVLGVALAFGIAQLAGWPIFVSPTAILLAVTFAGAVGVFFGFYPALKASRLDPIEALRSE